MEDTTPGKTGNNLVVIALCIAVLGGMTIFFGYLLDKIYNPNQQVIGRIDSSGKKEVLLLRNNSGHYVANGMINDHSVVFLLDTGATNVSIPKPIAEKLQLTAGVPIRVHTANGAITVRMTKLNTVSIGNIALENVLANINPHMGGEEVLLGMSFLKHLELVQQGNTLTLRIP